VCLLFSLPFSYPFWHNLYFTDKLQWKRKLTHQCKPSIVPMTHLVTMLAQTDFRLSSPHFSSRARPKTVGKDLAIWRMIPKTRGWSPISHGKNTCIPPHSLMYIRVFMRVRIIFSPKYSQIEFIHGSLFFFLINLRYQLQNYMF